MAIDLSGGMDASSDYFLAARPEDPQFRESASMWISDDEGVIGLPRVGIEAVSEEWDQRGLQVNLGFPDGRAVIVRELGDGRSVVDDDGICRTFGAGGLEFRCVEPFKTLTMTYDGTAYDTTAAAMARGELARAPRIPLRVDVEVTCAAPPWVSGTLNEDAAEVFHEGFAGAFISPRYEQLCTSGGRCAPATTSGRSPAPGCASTARARATRAASGDTAGPARCSRAVGASAASRSPNGPTASRPTTRPTCSTASG